MRNSIGVVSIILVVAFACTAQAQDSSESPEGTVANLKPLSAIEWKEAQFRMRLAELEEDLKPEKWFHYQYTTCGAMGQYLEMKNHNTHAEVPTL
jgi:hypothetical protein